MSHVLYFTYYSIIRQSFFNRVVSNFVAGKSIPQGAATTVYACVCPRISTEGMRGAYLADCGPAAPSSAACNKELAARFWKVSEEDLNAALVKLGIEK